MKKSLRKARERKQVIATSEKSELYVADRDPYPQHFKLVVESQLLEQPGMKRRVHVCWSVPRNCEWLKSEAQMS